MPLAVKMQTTRSCWTPLNHPLTNSKVFEERRGLLAKWFDRWSDGQRRAVLQDLVQSCSAEQLRFLRQSLSRRLPLQAADFTCLLPRALCLFIFSFLDPRSLSRCARVSWRWTSIVDLDQLWMPKCLKLGWCISFCPTPLEQGVWKRLYIHSVQELRLQVSRSDQQRVSLWTHHQPTALLQAAASQQQPAAPPSEPAVLAEQRPASSSQPHGGVCRRKQPAAPPPWRDSDRRPRDTLRFNYLDNLDSFEQQAAKVQMKSRASTCRRSTREPEDGRKELSEASYRLRKAKSLMLLSSDCRPQHPPPPPPPPSPPLLHHHHDPAPRPSWAARGHSHPVTMETARAMLLLARWNAGIRPAPVRPAVPWLSVEALRAARRSQRSAPSTPLFDAQPWTAAASHRRHVE